MRVYEVKVITAGSMAGNLTSNPFQLTEGFGAAASCVVTSGSSASGTLGISASVDGINFTPIEQGSPLAPVTLSVSGNGTYLFDVIQTSCQFLQVYYTRTSGTGTLDITVYGKGF